MNQSEEEIIHCFLTFLLLCAADKMALVGEKISLAGNKRILHLSSQYNGSLFKYQ